MADHSSASFIGLYTCGLHITSRDYGGYQPSCKRITCSGCVQGVCRRGRKVLSQASLRQITAALSEFDDDGVRAFCL
jgi:hypothetical protein